MKSISERACILVLAAALGACSSTGGGRDAGDGVDVARFHLGEPVARAQISIEPFDKADAGRPEYPAHANAVERQLTRLGWTVVRTPGTSEQVALIDVEQGSRDAIAALSAARIGRGMAAPMPSGDDGNVIATLLEVAIRRRSDGTVFWEGRAVAEDIPGKPSADAAVMVEKLVEALFRDFPGESGRTIRIR
ncbi:DUF4136 domain-containing protein [Sphingosinicella rhizophila]|uniref:DUF4136 domain-containing protein n=1 Tax=Sphingosinicella rhizophila TaxID=3050082 RepID=A0ABU3QCR6_9SPHN|nr:DUF4136 domain-containing protein [Sphingosinicella sp. GR2756]MDT9600934.1 DUF4136 domain-containing protein [Sphingosinicella sp. GR2756]